MDSKPAPPDPLADFHWTPQPAAQALVHQLLADLLSRSPLASTIAQRMRDETGTRFPDWLDHLTAPSSPDLVHRLQSAGFTARQNIYHHQGGIFPKILLTDHPTIQAAIKVESIVDFLSAWQLAPTAIIDGSPFAPLRKVSIAPDLWLVERHGYAGFDILTQDIAPVLKHQESFRRRPRDTEDFPALANLIDRAITDLGRGYATDLFFSAEREYWQRRNRAARAQKARQDRLGLGWANHDHHTYRSSRQHFAPMIAIFQSLGLICRERFYAGAQSGWGAQVMEHPQAGIIVFADVDLSPDELRGDFAHQGLPPRHDLGTVGLWCALHGESLFQSGMHHLECQFDFRALSDQLEHQEQIKVMKPFTDFTYLRQAFTEGEIWPIAADRLQSLLAAGQITPVQADRFRHQGALGSHLENLERNDGFKGFNQSGVSDIISRTDPRHPQPPNAPP